MTLPAGRYFTDYPFSELGDTPGEPAPVREVEVLSWDGDKYVDIQVEGQRLSVKRFYIYGSICEDSLICFSIGGMLDELDSLEAVAQGKKVPLDTTLYQFGIVETSWDDYLFYFPESAPSPVPIKERWNYLTFSILRSHINRIKAYLR